MAVVPDEDPALEPTIRLHSPVEHVIPYEIMRWFMEHVAEEVQRCRAASREGEPEAAGEGTDRSRRVERGHAL
ncbi:hypothetical protein [Streptomyces sp. 4N509B]|uniref:hypothetical protein n=1 Tax=Streptomyces sp. 4N509B TaxID=3457413 RepID=UPI003FD16C1C